jgi:hypothetical protein
MRATNHLKVIGIAALAAGGAFAAPPPEAPGKYSGATSCGGANCHASPEPKATPPYMQENTTWSAMNEATSIPYDRHSYAYNRLYNDEKSKTIMEALNGLEGTKAEAGESERCLSCHGVSTHDYAGFKGGIPVGIRKDLQGGKFAAEDGVSCDGCHGPAEKWAQPHATKGWVAEQFKKLGAEKLYTDVGIYYSKDAVLWANQCVRCHLAIDTNLIDAGHPDLVPFELFNQSQAMPPHWRDYSTQPAAKELPASGPYHGVRMWQTGQAGALASAAQQVALRARGVKPNKADPRHVAEAVDRAYGHWVALNHALKTAAPDKAAALQKLAEALKTAAAGEKPDMAKLAAAADEVAKAAKALQRTLADFPADEKYAKTVAAGLANDPAAFQSRRAAEQIAMGLYAVWASHLAKANPDALAANPPTDAVLAAIYEGFAALQGAEPHKDPALKGALDKIKAALK